MSNTKQPTMRAWANILRNDPCCYCGDVGQGTLEHVVPDASYGVQTNTVVNVVGACSECNNQRGAAPILTFLMTKHWSKRRRTRYLESSVVRAIRYRQVPMDAMMFRAFEPVLPLSYVTGSAKRIHTVLQDGQRWRSDDSSIGRACSL